jgi:hypothetical protein
MKGITTAERRWYPSRANFTEYVLAGPGFRTIGLPLAQLMARPVAA